MPPQQWCTSSGWHETSNCITKLHCPAFCAGCWVQTRDTGRFLRSDRGNLVGMNLFLTVFGSVGGFDTLLLWYKCLCICRLFYFTSRTRVVVFICAWSSLLAKCRFFEPYTLNPNAAYPNWRGHYSGPVTPSIPNHSHSWRSPVCRPSRKVRPAWSQKSFGYSVNHAESVLNLSTIYLALHLFVSVVYITQSF